MEKLLPTLKLKLKRHKLRFSYDERRKVLTLGGTAISFSMLLAYIILPFILLLAVAAYIIVSSDVLTYIKETFLFICVLSAIVVGGRMFRQKIRKNRNLKIFYSDHFVIIDGKYRLEISLADILGFEKSILDSDHSLVQGDLFLRTEKRNYLLLSIVDESVGYVENDLDFFESFFRKLWHTEEGKKKMYSATSVVYKESELFLPPYLKS